MTFFLDLIYDVVVIFHALSLTFISMAENAKKNFKSLILPESRKLLGSIGEKGERSFWSIESARRVTSWLDFSREDSIKDIAIVTKMKNVMIPGVGYSDVPVVFEFPLDLLLAVLKK